MIYLDNAATTGKKPQYVVAAMKNALENFSANPGRSGHIAALRAGEAVFKARQKIADFFGGEAPENVIFTQNCTHSINCVLKGVLKKGDHLVISNLEHNAVVRPLKKMGISFDVADVSFTHDDITIENFKKKIRPNTRMIFTTAASNVAGKTLPLKELGAIAQEKGLLFGVDAAQTAGVLPIDMKEMGIDFLCIAPHKGLYAPMGIGILIARKRIENTIIEGGTGTNSLELFQPALPPERHESGTINLPGIISSAAGISFIKEKGIDKIYNHEMKLIQMLYNKLSDNSKIILYTPFPSNDLYVPVLSLNVVGKMSEEVAEELAKHKIAVRAGYHCAPFAHNALGTLDGGTVRVALGYFNTAEEIKQFVNVLNKIAQK